MESLRFPSRLPVMLQNHDIKKVDAQQTFRLMHYFAVEGKTFPPGFPRVDTPPSGLQPTVIVKVFVYTAQCCIT